MKPIPYEAISKVLAQAMDIAVSHGANSISMPDEYVEIAAWLADVEKTLNRISGERESDLDKVFKAYFPKPEKYLIGQRVLLSDKEIGTVVKSETGFTKGVWVFSPSRGYASDYSLTSVRPLPGGQL